jgi:hypothetical protein
VVSRNFSKTLGVSRQHNEVTQAAWLDDAKSPLVNRQISMDRQPLRWGHDGSIREAESHGPEKGTDTFITYIRSMAA